MRGGEGTETAVSDSKMESTAGSEAKGAVLVEVSGPDTHLPRVMLDVHITTLSQEF